MKNSPAHDVELQSIVLNTANEHQALLPEMLQATGMLRQMLANALKGIVIAAPLLVTDPAMAENLELDPRFKAQLAQKKAEGKRMIQEAQAERAEAKRELAASKQRVVDSQKETDAALLELGIDLNK